MIDVSGYGRALFLLAQEDRTENEVREQLHLVCAAVKENPEYTTLLDTPAIAKSDKTDMLKQAFGAMNQMLVNFLCLLCEKRSFYCLESCREAFDECYDEAHNILRATAITAVPMSEKQKDALQRKLSIQTGKNVEAQFVVDPSILGGITLRYGGIQLDDSIRAKLDSISRSLAETVV